MGFVVVGEKTTVGVCMGIIPDTVTGVPASPLIMAGNWNVFIWEFMDGLSARGLSVLQKCSGTNGVPLCPNRGLATIIGVPGRGV